MKTLRELTPRDQAEVALEASVVTVAAVAEVVVALTGATEVTEEATASQTGRSQESTKREKTVSRRLSWTRINSRSLRMLKSTAAKTSSSLQETKT